MCINSFTICFLIVTSKMFNRNIKSFFTLNTFNNTTDAILRFIGDLQRDNFKTYFQSRYFRMEYDLDRIDRTFNLTKNIHVSYRDLKREQMFRKKDKNYLDTLLKKFKEKSFDGIVMVEFVDHDSEKVFYKDIEKLKSY